ncbi:MAG: AAA family ATPase, partial [Lamprocystis purpurea]|nr:AAA family ATPase [Lamprocystis purpurea]
FQVFDKGWMEDAEGRYIDFHNTVILLTSNAGTDLIMSMCKDPDLMPDVEGLAQALRTPLLKTFPPALLGRIVTIPYYPLSDEMLGTIIRLQLDRIVRRIADNHRAVLSYNEAAVDLIAKRCAEVESGARVVDAILTNTVLPAISREILNRTMEGKAILRIAIGVADSGFTYDFDG